MANNNNANNANSNNNATENQQQQVQNPAPAQAPATDQQPTQTQQETPKEGFLAGFARKHPKITKGLKIAGGVTVGGFAILGAAGTAHALLTRDKGQPDSTGTAANPTPTYGTDRTDSGFDTGFGGSNGGMI